MFFPTEATEQLATQKPALALPSGHCSLEPLKNDLLDSRRKAIALAAAAYKWQRQSPT